MEGIQQVLDQIPIRHNLASHLMFLGIVQGIFLTFVVFVRTKKKSAIRLFAWALLVQILVFTDTYLCYTGVMKYMLHFNDSTEIFVLLIAPTIYFFIYALLERKSVSFKKHWPHFILPIGYGLSQINYYTSPLEIKLNAYLGAYYSDLGFLPTPEGFNYSYLFIKDEFRWLILISLVFYLILSVRLVIKARRKKGFTPKKIKIDKYIFSRNTVVLFIFLVCFLFLIYLNFEDDGGDHYIGILQTLITFSITYFIISESRFFEKSWIADKYETLTTNTVHFSSIEKSVADGAYFLTEKVSLQDLADKLQTSPNLVSKLINSETGYNFNDYINQKRVAVAKERLVDSQFAHLTVEAIGLSVGFSSKSAFYNAFKKHVGIAPSAFMKQKVG